MQHHHWFGATGLRSRVWVAALLAAGCVISQQSFAAEESPFIVESTKARVSLADIEAELAKLTADARAQFAVSRQRLMQLVNTLYLNRAAAVDARAAGLDRDPVVARQIAAATDKILAQAQFDKLDREKRAEVDANSEKYLARAREIYLTRPDAYRSPERVHVSHILVRVGAGAGGDEAAKAQAEALRAKALSGVPFDELARASSEDRNAKSNGGDLGFIEAVGIDPAFAAAAFKLNTPGELSPVIKGTSGYHVIKYHERQAPAQLPFDAVKSTLLSEVRQQAVEMERSAYQSGLLANPPPKVNDPLIDKITADARKAAMQLEAQSAKKARR